MNNQYITLEDIIQLSGFDGNIDEDSIAPFIFMAENNEIKRILGKDLYLKTKEETLVDPYLTIKNEYANIICAYWACSYYLQLGIVKVTQTGAYLVTPENTQAMFAEQTQKMAEKYEALARGLEIKLVEYLNTLTIPEWISPNQTTAKSGFNWIKI